MTLAVTESKVPGPLLLLRAFMRRDFGIALSYRVPFMVDAFQSVLTVAFLYFLARVVGHKVIAATGLKVSYFGFAVIGSVLIGILTVSLASFSRRIRTDQMTGTLEVLFSLPPRPWLVVLSSASYQVVYAIITSAITLAVSFWLGLRFHVTGLSIGVALADFMGALLIFSALGVVLAAFVMVFKRGETLTTLLIGGLGLIGGVLYPVQDLSHPLRIIADLLPFTWALEVMRAALLGAQSDLIRLAEVWAVTIVAFPVSIWVFGYALTHAKKKGTVGQY
jgi:ABC-type multidrug transport system permease subunit